jgi:hypothetical protein
MTVRHSGPWGSLSPARGPSKPASSFESQRLSHHIGLGIGYLCLGTLSPSSPFRAESLVARMARRMEAAGESPARGLLPFFPDPCAESATEMIAANVESACAWAAAVRAFSSADCGLAFFRFSQYFRASAESSAGLRWITLEGDTFSEVWAVAVVAKHASAPNESMPYLDIGLPPNLCTTSPIRPQSHR